MIEIDGAEGEGGEEGEAIMAAPVQSETVVEVTERDLPLHCPTPQTPVWSYHPRVFLDVAEAITERGSSA